MYGKEWDTQYRDWFKTMYGIDPASLANEIDMAIDYYEHDLDTLSLILDNKAYAIEDRDEFLTTYDQILDKDVTYDCPEEEIEVF